MFQVLSTRLATRAGSAAILLFCAVGWAPVQAGTCGCTDIADIKKRLSIDDTAMKTYQEEIRKIVEQQQRQQTVLPADPGKRAELERRVNLAIAQNRPGGISATPHPKGRNPGGTGNLCDVFIDLDPSATACMRETLTRHENFHKEMCERSPNSNLALDRHTRAGTSLMAYAMEEIGGYSTEQKFLKTELSRLEKDPECQPKKPMPVETRDYTGQPRSRSSSSSPNKPNPVDSLRRRFGF